MTKINSEVQQAVKTTYHVFVLSIESGRLSCLICLVTACYSSWQENLSTQWGWKSADINTSNVMVWWLIPAQSRAGSWPTRTPLLTSSSHPKKVRTGRRLPLIPDSKSHIYEWFTPGVEGLMQMSTKEVVSSIVLWPMEGKLHLSCAIGCTKKRDQNGALSASFHTRGRCVSFYNILWGLSWLLKENMPVSWEPVKASWNQDDFSLGWAGFIPLNAEELVLHDQTSTFTICALMENWWPLHLTAKLTQQAKIQ